MRVRLVLEKAFLAAAYLQDLQMARESFARIKLNRRQANSLYWRAKAAIQLLAGNIEDARETAVHGMRSVASATFMAAQSEALLISLIICQNWASIAFGSTPSFPTTPITAIMPPTTLPSIIVWAALKM